MNQDSNHRLFCRDCRDFECVSNEDGASSYGFCASAQTKNAEGMVVGFLDRNAVACQFFGPVRSAVKSGFLASLLQAPMLAPGVLVERRVEFTAGRPKIQEKVLMASGMPDIALDASASAFTRAAARRMFANKSFGQLVMKFRRYGEGIGFGVLVAVEATTYPVGGKIGNV